MRWNRNRKEGCLIHCKRYSRESRYSTSIAPAHQPCQQKISLEKSKLAFEQQELDLERTIYQAYTDAQGALKAYDAAVSAANACCAMVFSASSSRRIKASTRLKPMNQGLTGSSRGWPAGMIIACSLRGCAWTCRSRAPAPAAAANVPAVPSAGTARARSRRRPGA